MNHKQANSVKDLAAPVNEVLERLEVECPKCEGEGEIDIGMRWAIEKPICPICKGKHIIPYSWQPKVGEWFLTDYNVLSKPQLIRNDVVCENVLADVLLGKKSIVILIPEWEEIERVLEKAGYRIKIEENYKSNTRFKCWLGIYEGGATYKELAYTHFKKSRIEAVYDAVNKLGKKLK